MNLDDLPAATFTCSRCGHAHTWTSFTPTALERADGDGAPCLVCAQCRIDETARRRPISVEIKRKGDTLRRAEARSLELASALERLRYARRLCYWRQPASQSEQTLARKLDEATRAVNKHRRELARLQQARAGGVSERVSVSRRTAHYPSIPYPTETHHVQ